MKRVFSVVLSLAVLVFAPAGAGAQSREITGVVSGENGRPLAGARVVVGSGATGVGAPGSQQASGARGVNADNRGVFRISVPAGNVQLSASLVGYRNREVSVPAGQNTVNFQLVQDVLNLEAVVVTGQATATRRENLANDVVVVTSQDLTGRVPAQTIERALQGKVAGATIRANSGAPGGGVQIRLRGPATITGNSSPLFVVDGVVVSDVSIPGGQNAVSRAASGAGVNFSVQDQQVNRIADLNPNDIESVEILKGASAASIYGSRAAAGVVVITTKRGRAGAPRFTLNQRFGYAEISRKLGSRVFTRDEAIAAGFVTAADASEYFNPDGTQKQVYDLEDQVFGRKAPQLETSISVSGGNEATQYYASGQYTDDQGIAANTGYEKQAATLGLRQTLGSRVRINASTQVLHSVAARGVTGNDNTGASYVSAISFTPSFFSLDGANGVYPRNPFADSNPLETSVRSTNDEDVWRVIGSLNGTADLLQAGAHTLRLVGTGGVDYFNQDNRLYFPSNIQLQPFPNTPGTAVSGGGTNLNLNTSVNLVHTFSPSSGVLQATTSGGVQYADQDLRLSQVTGRYLLGTLEQPFQAASQVAAGSRQRIRGVGGYVQEELLLLDETLALTGSVRGDRSSNNADTDKLYYYPKLAAAYTVPRSFGVLDQLKLRSAYGASGNVPLYAQKFTPLTVNNIEGTPSVIIFGNVGAPDLRPERVTELEGGFDATLFGQRALLTVTGYRRNITELLLSRGLATSSGFVTQFFNGGAMESTGLETSLQASLVQRGALEWNSTTTFSHNRTEVTDLPVPEFSAGNSFGTGFGSFLIRKGYSPTTVFANNGPEGVVPIGESEPDFQIGFLNDVRFGRFSLSSLFDWSKGGLVVNLTRNYYDAIGTSPDWALPAGVTAPRPWAECGLGCASGYERDYWHRAANGGYATYVEPGGFVKLRELSLTYDIPMGLVGNRVNNAQIQVSGRNLKTWSDYSGYDPEVSNFGNVSAGRNIDVTPFPPNRTFWVGINLGF